MDSWPLWILWGGDDDNDDNEDVYEIISVMDSWHLLLLWMMTMMEIMMLEAPICENVLQILDMTIPKPKFRSSQEQLLLQGTMESDPPEAPTWAIGDPSSCMISIYILDNEVSRPADTPCGPQKWRNSINCCYKLILGETEC